MVAFAFWALFFCILFLGPSLSHTHTQKKNNNTGLLRQLSRKVVQVVGRKLRPLLLVRISVIEIVDRNSDTRIVLYVADLPGTLQQYNVCTQHTDVLF